MGCCLTSTVIFENWRCWLTWYGCAHRGYTKVAPYFYTTLNMGVYDDTDTFISRSYGLGRSLPKTLAAGASVVTPIFVPLSALPIDELLRRFEVTVRRPFARPRESVEKPSHRRGYFVTTRVTLVGMSTIRT